MSAAIRGHSEIFPVEEVAIPAGDVALTGTLARPLDAMGLVAMAHVSGSSRFGPRNVRFATVLNRRGIATLQVDLLTAEEETHCRSSALRADSSLLASRLCDVADWVDAALRWRRPFGLFAASTGAAVALIAVTRLRDRVAAIVTRSGRTDLASESVGLVLAPTLFIVGTRDAEILAINRAALAGTKLNRRSSLLVVPGAGHLFEEPGTLDVAAEAAADWYCERFGPPPD